MKPSTIKPTAVKATRQSAAVKTSTHAGSSACGIRSDDTAVIKSAKGAWMEARGCRSEGVAVARIAKVGVTSRGPAEIVVTQRCAAPMRVTVIVKTPAVMEETRAA